MSFLALLPLALLPASTVAPGPEPAPPPAPAVTFHFMQIEQVIGGVHGDTSAQAIQLRMRAGGQTQVSASRLRAHDAQGLNPILLIDIPSNVAFGGQGRRVLCASSSFTSETNPAASPDFTLAATIPASYLAAGSLTFESDGGTVYWRVSWGGASYTGPTTGNITNDADGDFGPPFAGALPSATSQALLFQNGAGAPSTTNAADYAVTSGAAVFTNNAASSFTVKGPGCPAAGGPALAALALGLLAGGVALLRRNRAAA